MTTLGVLIPTGVPKQGGSGMALGPAIATGAAQVVGGWLGGKGASRAAKSQALAQQQALNYQRSRDAIADQRYKTNWDDYQKRYSTWEEMTRSQLGMGAPSGGGAAAGPQSLGELAGAGVPSGEGAAPTAADFAGPAGSLGEMAQGSDWTDWRRYGAGVQ